MTRDEAIGKLSHLYSQADSLFLVNALEALGLLKFDEPKGHEAWVLGNKLSERGVHVASHVIINALDAAGLKIVEK